jgi:hypothetical protein
VEKFLTRDIYINIDNLQEFTSRTGKSLLRMQTVPQPVSFAFLNTGWTVVSPKKLPHGAAHSHWKHLRSVKDLCNFCSMQSTAQILDKMDLTVFVTRCFVHSGTGLSRIGQQSLQLSRCLAPIGPLDHVRTGAGSI